MPRELEIKIFKYHRGIHDPMKQKMLNCEICVFFLHREHTFSKHSNTIVKTSNHDVSHDTKKIETFVFNKFVLFIKDAKKK